MFRFQEEILWKGKWEPNDGHLINIKMALNKVIKYGSSAPIDILKGERGLEFYFGKDARNVMNYFVSKGPAAIGGIIKYQGKIVVDIGDLSVLATNLNKMKFLPSKEFVQWVNSD